MISDSELLALYDAQMRANPASESDIAHKTSGGVLRAIGSYNCILFTHLHSDNADAAIADQVAFFNARKAALEWKVYGHDLPTDLGQRLGAAGFKPDEEETLMAFDLAAHAKNLKLPPAVEFRRIIDAADFEDFAAVSGAAFGQDDRPYLDAIRSRLDEPTLSLYVAYAGGQPVSAGRLELPPGRAFAGIWGGGTIPDFRKRGIYRGLVAVRANEALGKGYRYLTVDARETSRPVLERLGFRALTSVRGWMLN